MRRGHLLCLLRPPRALLLLLLLPSPLPLGQAWASLPEVRQQTVTHEAYQHNEGLHDDRRRAFSSALGAGLGFLCLLYND
jgi:hypothetical protein